jgi:hypothetical protein
MRNHPPTLAEIDSSVGEQPVNRMRERAGDIRGNPRIRGNRSGVMIGVGAVCAILGALSLATQQIWSTVAGTVIEIDTPILGTTLYAAQIALFAVAVAGLYLYQRHAFSRFGKIAARVAVVGTLLWSGSAAWQAAEVIKGGGKQASDYTSTSLLVWILVPVGLYAVGLILFGIATWRAGVLPRVPAALVVFGIPLGLAFDGLALMVYGTGLAWLSIAALAQLRSGRSVHADRPAALAS